MKKKVKKIKGFTIQFIPYSEIKDLDSNQRIKKILEIILGNNILKNNQYRLLSALSEGMSGADIETLCNMIRTNKPRVGETSQIIADEVRRLMAKTEKTEKKTSDQWSTKNSPTCFHHFRSIS
ncbi:MAG: hypothetical protein IID15_08605 [Candidatus Marinimicrobia bacterium]|nr:hypothetical protein [Candidatus Neomarinimicrobiota bacterium]